MHKILPKIKQGYRKKNFIGANFFNNFSGLKDK